MSTAREIITGSFRLLNLIQANEVPSSADINIGLDALNEMIDSWSNERLSIYSVQPWYFTLNPMQQVYTLGTGGDWDVPRPMDIFQLYVSYGADIQQAGWSPVIFDGSWHSAAPTGSLTPTLTDGGYTLNSPAR